MNLLSINVTEFAGLFLDVAAKGMLLLALAFTTVRCMKRSSAAARHLTLSLALGSLLALPLLSSMLPQLNVLPRWMGASSSLSQRANEIPFEHTFSANKGAKNSQSASIEWSRADSQRLPPTITDLPSEASRSPITVLLRLLTVIWLLGAFCTLLPMIIGLLSLTLLRRRSRVIKSGPLYELLQRLKTKTGCRRNVLLLSSTARRMPMMWGTFHPRILLPHDCYTWPEERLRVVLLHELAHIQRFDFLTTLIARIACAFYWFNPLAWIAARTISYEQEKACDDMVLRQGTAPENYAEEVLQFASARSLAGLESYTAVAMARRSSLEGRLLAILDSDRNRTSLSRTACLIASVFVGLTVVPMAMLKAAVQRNARPDGLVAWWRGDGNGNDSAGDHNGTFPFGERYAPGLVGSSSFNFLRSHSIDHQLQRLSIADSPDFELTETMTLETWVYPLEYSGIVLIRGDDRGGYDAWQVDLMTKGRISYVFNSADNQAAAVSAPIQLNQWQHVAVVFDRGSMKLYVNAILAAQMQTPLRPIAVLDKGANPALGIGNAGGKFYSMPFNGAIDEVRIYNRALTEAEIEENMRR